MKNTLFILILFVSISSALGQKYFTPVPGGLENVNTGENYYTVTIKGKDSLAIYKSLHTMIENTFTDVGDEILETRTGYFIRARGSLKKAICKTYDLLVDVDFKIKNGQYSFSFSKFKMLGKVDGTIKTIELKKRTTDDTNESDTIFMFNTDGNVSIDEKCYKDIISNLDFIADLFDLTDDYDKWEAKSKRDNKQ